MNIQDSISFVSEDVSFNLDSENNTLKWIHNVISLENKILGEITYIFCSDNYLYKINLEHLNHDTYTDIITFNYNVGEIINSDIFISIDRVKENAIFYNTTFQEELNRVIIHGILHLLGYEDKSNSEKKLMRIKEDFYLTLLQI